MKLFLDALIKYLGGLITIGLLIFLPAGSFNYYNGWLFMCLLFIPMLIIGIVLFLTNKELLKKRLDVKEKDNTQKEVILLSAIMFILGFIIAGLNYQYMWTKLPKWIVISSSIIFVLSYILYFEILRENNYLSRTIKVEKKQQIIDTGLYKIVRHPMYLITIIMFLMIPIILDSIFSFIIFLIYPIIIVKRINNEEIVLEKELKGYCEYQKKVKYRLIPYIW